MDHPRSHSGLASPLRPTPGPDPTLGVLADAGAPGTGWTSLLVHGSFFLATCGRCGWTGSARRAQDTAQRDGLRHRQACPGPPTAPPTVVAGRPDH